VTARPPKAIVLAAGRGERMRPLTDHTPKPLLEVHGRPMLAWHLLALAAAGVREVVINTAWLEERIVEVIGDGSRYGLAVHYSREARDHGGALETAGGIATALPWLVERPSDVFWVVSGDIHAPDFHFDPAALRHFDDPARLAHLWLVPNPPFHARGDFGIDAEGFGLADGAGADGQRWTYANLALLRGELLQGTPAGQHAPLGPLLFGGMRERRISVEVYRGRWHNIGTPAQLEALNRGD
jgi:N-acetyl-alpha-D-muramate 1-phosphate uridylyltransferase